MVQDNELATWNAYGNEYWPAEYFIDARGNVRHTHFGEGDYKTDERVIQSLLAEAGDRASLRVASVQGAIASAGATTPESYLGAARAERFANGAITEGTRDYGLPRTPGSDQLRYAGRWSISREAATVLEGSISLNFNARRVYLVMGGDRARAVRVQLDGRPLRVSEAGSDVHDGSVSARSERLYALVNLPSVQRHTLTLQPQPGLRLFDFTFG